MRQVLLAVSFGTSVEEARALDLAGVERALRRAAPELPFDRAYTSPTVRRILARRGERVPGLEYTLSLHDALPIRSEERRVGKECKIGRAHV